MVKSGKTEMAKERFYAAKKPIKLYEVNVDNIVISKLVNLVNLNKDIRPLVLIMHKMSGYVKTFKIENKISEVMSFRIDVETLLEKYKAIWTNIEHLQNIKLNPLPVYDDRYIKTERKTFGDKVLLTFVA